MESGRWMLLTGALLSGCGQEAPPSAAATGDAASAKPWRECLERVTRPMADRFEEHDAWLEVSERLEARLTQDPRHIGVLRDLLAAYANLLGFERTTGLGTNICRVASRRLEEFCTLAAPLSDSDARFVEKIRASLFTAMALYPCASEALERAGGGTAPAPMLDAIGQRHFSEMESFSSGPLTVRVFRTRGTAPDSKLLWSEMHFIAARSSESRPDRTVAYSLARTGTDAETRYYLFFRSLNRSTLVQPYGRTRPTDAEVRAQVAMLLEEALKEEP